MPNKRRVTSIIGAALNASKGEASLHFRQTNGDQFDLIAPSGLVHGLFGILAGMSQKLSSLDKTGVTAQPMTLTSARHALGPTRQPTLDLTVEGTGHLVLTIPREGIEPLRTALAELLELSKPIGEAH
jgi:hypothetical protein